MKRQIKYWDVFNSQLKSLTNNIDTKNANPSGAARAMIILVPLLLISALFEYLWILIFKKNLSKNINK
jgi:hypothetical protein